MTKMHQPVESDVVNVCPLCSGVRGFVSMWDATSGNYVICNQCHRRIGLDGKPLLTLQDQQSIISNHTLVIEELIRENVALKERVMALETHVRDLVQKMNEVYYAPAMPGYVKAQAHFSNMDVHH